MRRAPHWYQLSNARLDREREQLSQLPYFTLERTSINEESNFTATGVLHFTSHRTGRHHEFRIRLQYPATFPKEIQRVFDHDQRFTPSLDGHLFSTYELCLTLPERHEFTTGSAGVTEEIVGASLVWFHKRLIFDRTRRWPGPAERHGINAVIDLLVERNVASDAGAISKWLLAHATTPAGHVRTPDLYAPCPCGNGKRVKFCHREDLQLIFHRLARFPTGCQLTDILGIKEGGT
jgi:hypothetical protein